MVVIKIFVLLGIVGYSFGLTPKPGLHDLKAKRDGSSCTPETMPDDTPQTDCPHKNTVDNNSQCSGPISPNNYDSDQGCTAYCEQSIAKKYGSEVAFSTTHCSSNDSCTFTSTKAITYTVTWTINGNINIGLRKRDDVTDFDLTKRADPAPDPIKITSSFNLGASYSWSESVTYSEASTHTRPSSSTGKCGYWTFVPYLIESCGVFTVSGYTIQPQGHEGSINKCSTQYTSTQNYCNTVPYRKSSPDSADSADGAIVFVLVDCDGKGLLPMDQQDPIYQYPGVSSGQAAVS